MNPGIIFDLDQTLLDTSSVAHLRDAKNWSAIYPLIKGFSAFETVDDTIAYLNNIGVKVIIVTTSPRPYCVEIIEHCGWTTAGQICFHDVKRRKPDPESFSKAILDHGLDITKTITVGDRDIDIMASNALDLPSIACTWASPDKAALLAAKPTFIAHGPGEMSSLIRKFYNKQ